MEWLYLFEVFLYSMECICVLINIHSVHKKVLNFSKANVIFFAIYLIYFIAVSIFYGEYDGNNLYSVIMALIIFVWSYIVFKQKLFNELIKSLFVVIMLAVEQATGVLIVSLLNIESKVNLYVTYGILAIITLVIAIIIYVLILRPKIKIKITPVVANIVYFITILICFNMLLYLKQTFWMLDGIYVGIFCACCGIFIMVIIVVFLNVNVTKQLQQKELELELNNKYTKTYEELILSMRQKQHDYKNQLSALYSMHLVAKDKEQLVQMQRDYGDELNTKDEVDNILFQGDNPVICGYVYSKCITADKQGVKIEPHMSYGDGEFTVPLHKLIEIFGILIDNAVEYLSDFPMEDKIIKLHIDREQDKLNIQVSNIVKNFNYDDLENIFKPGYTTKGKERGIGLSSLKAIVKEYKGDILVENHNDHDKDWLNIKVVI